MCVYITGRSPWKEQDFHDSGSWPLSLWDQRWGRGTVVAILSESLLCHSTDGLRLAFVLCCRFEPLPAELPWLLSWWSARLECRVPWVWRGALSFSLEKKSCPGCSWLVCFAFAFLSHLLVVVTCVVEQLKKRYFPSTFSDEWPFQGMRLQTLSTRNVLTCVIWFSCA